MACGVMRRAAGARRHLRGLPAARVAASLLALALAVPIARAQPLSLEQAQEAARRNAEVVIAERSLAAARADIQAADHAPLPQLTGKLSQIDLQGGLGPGSWWAGKRIDKSVGVDWTWERGDKRALRTQAAQQAAQGIQADVEELRNQQQLAAQAAWVDLLAAQLRLQEVQAISRSAEELARTAARRLAAGDLSQQDAVRAAIEAERARADLDAAMLERARAQLSLAPLVGRPPPVVDIEARGSWPAAANLGDLEADTLRAQAARADVQAARARVQAAQAQLALARSQQRSDVTWGASLDHYPGTSTRMVELRLQVPLQWGYRYEGEIARAQAQLDQARDILARTEQAAGVELARLHAEARTAATRARRYEEEIVPRAREVAERADVAYAKGALSLSDLLEARRTLRAALLEALAVRADRAKADLAWQLRAASR